MAESMGEPPFGSLDYIYAPSADVGAELADLEVTLGARVLFAIEEMGTRVAMIELAEGAPQLLLAGHLRGGRPVLVFRVADLKTTMARLAERGWKKGRMIELPMGPACAFTARGGHRIAIYERTRPEVTRHFEGRRDF
jgi:hypothetical protein